MCPFRRWSGSRTRDTRINRPMLYPSELSSGGRTGFEPVANGMHRCSPKLSYRPLEEPLLPRFGIRHGSAARTGRNTNPYRCSVFDRCSPLPAVANRQSVRAPGALVGVLSTCSPRRGITTQRTCAGRSRAPASGRTDALPGCPRAETKFRGGKKRTWSMHAHPPRTLETKRPRVLRPEGVRVPREIGAADLPRSQPDVRRPGAVRVRYRAGRTRPRAAPGRSVMAAGRACCRRNRRASWE